MQEANISKEIDEDKPKALKFYKNKNTYILICIILTLVIFACIVFYSGKVNLNTPFRATKDKPSLVAASAFLPRGAAVPTTSRTYTSTPTPTRRPTTINTYKNQSNSVVNLINTEYFKTNYGEYSKQHGNFDTIQTFSSGLVLKEFYDTRFANEFFAGHVGALYGPPYAAPNFETGLVITNRNSPGSFVYETGHSKEKTITTWRPDAMIVADEYPGGTYITGTKTNIPGTRGFGLKLDIKNGTTSKQPYTILILANVPNLTYGFNWNWGNSNPIAADTVSYAKDGAVVIKANSQPIYMLIGIANHANTWTSYDYSSVAQLVSAFKTNTTLSNTSNDTASATGSSVGFSLALDSLESGQTKSIQLIGFIGGREDEVLALWNG